MVYLGNQTSCWTPTPTEPFEYALAQEFNAFEWFPDKKADAGWDESDINGEARRAIRDRARSQGMRLSVHARWQANPLAADGYALLGKDLELARDLGAALLNIHLIHEQGLEAFVRGIIRLIQQTSQLGLQLSIENTPHHTPEQFKELFDRLRGLSSVAAGHVGMCLDVGHANLCAATRNDYLQFYDRLGPDVPIIHLHLHENWGDQDSHLPLFTGPAGRDDSGVRGLIARLRQRHFSGSLILEQWPQPPSLLNQARDRWLELWKAAGNGASPGAPVPPVVGPVNRDQAAMADFTDELVASDREARSWREKLDSVFRLLTNEARAIRADDLVDVAIYLRFLGTGEIPCVEDGRHFRPVSHARISSQIQERLAGLTTPENEFIVRRIYPWLPSSAQTFQRPEPLTRIRDIAHRNDLSPDLKREIKTTLQNKLHRCAGPEDLVTASALLERVTAPGAQHPTEFVAQFKIFVEELKEFFNAQTLDQRLRALKGSAKPEFVRLIELFLEQRAGKSLPNQLATLRTLVSLRKALLQQVQEKPGSAAQECLLADIALEEHAFVILSEIINLCETGETRLALDSEIQALVLSMDCLLLSGIEREESDAIGHELRQWGPLSDPPLRDELLRMKSSVLRCRRLADTFGEKIVSLISHRAEKLGSALGIAPHAIRVFSEADLRSQTIFQTAKLVSGLLRRLRRLLGAPAWDVLVGGRALGLVRAAKTLAEVPRATGELAIVLLKTAAGDEEIPPNVAAIVLAHELPHLSHLGVRARQAGTVFVACEEPAQFEKLGGSKGGWITLTALPDQVTWEPASNSGRSPSGPTRPVPRIPAVQLNPPALLLPIERARPDTCGGKANGARELAELSKRSGAGFSTPASLAIPFGVLEAALAFTPELNARYQEELRRLKGMSVEEVASGARRLREILRQVPVPVTIVEEVERRFPEKTALVVRSSTNGEDLELFAGAGLYDSVINVPPADVGSALRQVWSSLWTERAALSRREANIAPEQVHMAVLIQELIDPELSFILHTVHPVTANPREVYAEVVVGLGETLASAATRGTPYRLVCNKDSGRVVTEGFCNFSRVSRPGPGGGVRWETVDYSDAPLSRDAAARESLGRRLAAIGSLVEHAFGKSQDVEGAVLNNQIYLVQSRAQQGLTPQ